MIVTVLLPLQRVRLATSDCIVSISPGSNSAGFVTD